MLKNRARRNAPRRDATQSNIDISNILGFLRICRGVHAILQGVIALCRASNSRLGITLKIVRKIAILGNATDLITNNQWLQKDHRL